MDSLPVVLIAIGRIATRKRDFMKQNPCRYCSSSFKYKGIHSPGIDDCCGKCEHYKKHKEYLLSQRKFQEGEPIKTMEDLLKEEWVMWYHRTKHIEVFKHMQLSNVLRFLENGAFHKAIKKVEEN